MYRKHFIGATFLGISLLAVFALGISGMALAATDLALGGTATQSSSYPGFPDGPQLAIDGNTDANFNDGSVTATNLDPQAWWQVDLGSTFRIDSIVLWNRTDCCSDRLSNFNVSVLDSGHNTVWSSNYFTGGGFPSPSLTINPPSNTSGRFVKVSLNGTNYLSLAEVQVYGGIGVGPSASAVPAVTQSGIILLGLAGLAIIIYSRKKRIT